MYDVIYNFKTNNWVKSNSETGTQIIRSYINNLKGGTHTVHPSIHDNDRILTQYLQSREVVLQKREIDLLAKISRVRTELLEVRRRQLMISSTLVDRRGPEITRDEEKEEYVPVNEIYNEGDDPLATILKFFKSVSRRLHHGQVNEDWAISQYKNLINGGCKDIKHIVRRLFSKSFKQYPQTSYEKDFAPHAKALKDGYSKESMKAMKFVILKWFIKQYYLLHVRESRRERMSDEWATKRLRKLEDSGTISLQRLLLRIDEPAISSGGLGFKGYTNSTLVPPMTPLKEVYRQKTINNMRVLINSLKEGVSIGDNNPDVNAVLNLVQIGNECFENAIANARNHPILSKQDLDEAQVLEGGKKLAKLHGITVEKDKVMAPLELQMNSTIYKKMKKILGPKKYNKGLYDEKYISALESVSTPAMLNNRRKWRTVMMKDVRTIWSNDKIREHKILGGNHNIPMSNLVLAEYPNILDGLVKHWVAEPRDYSRKGKGQRTDSTKQNILAPARKFSVEKLKKMYTKLCTAINSEKKVIMKASHGANSDAIQIYDSIPTEKDFKNTVNQFISGTSAAWEDWAVYQVRHGIIIEELFPIYPPFKKPIEIKVQTVWGKVVFGTLETHPWDLIINCNGEVTKINRAEVFADRMNDTNPDSWGYKYSNGKIPEFTRKDKNVLEACLNEHWAKIVEHSETIAKLSGTEEMRCDWFLEPANLKGRPTKCVLNEIAYIGGFKRFSDSTQKALTNTILKGFVLNGGNTTEDFNELYPTL